jgi:hypothetical protein
MNCMAMLSIHRDIDVDVQTVTDDLAKLGGRPSSAVCVIDIRGL